MVPTARPQQLCKTSIICHVYNWGHSDRVSVRARWSGDAHAHVTRELTLSITLNVSSTLVEHGLVGGVQDPHTSSVWHGSPVRATATATATTTATAVATSPSPTPCLLCRLMGEQRGE